MAFTLAAIVGSTTVTLNDGNPFELISARGISSADVRRVTTRGPAQHGDTDLGYRLGLREVELVIGFKATSDAALDAHRDTLTGLFRPLPSTPVKLRITRDDNKIRQLDCYVVGDIRIDLVPEYRPGHYHRATVRLRAPDPAYYEIVPGTATVTGTASVASSWWLAGGAIGSANVLMSGGTPSPGANWSYAGTLSASDSYTLVFRGAASGNAGELLYGVDNNGAGNFGYLAADPGGTADLIFGKIASSPSQYSINNVPLGSAAMVGTLNYFYTRNGAIGRNYFYRTSPTSPTTVENLAFWDAPYALSGSLRRWRVTQTAGTGWAAPVQLYALYDTQLSISQLTALNTYMEGNIGGTIAQALAVPYEGDLPEYPTITIRGPITGASIVNTATGDTISFGTVSIAAGVTYTINTHPLHKTVVQGSTNKRGDLSADSNLGDWHLAPAPVATGGTNVITVTGTNAGTATQVSVVYYNRYTSF